MSLELHANQERIRPQLEHLAELAREGDRRAKEEITAMGIQWRGVAPAPTPTAATASVSKTALIARELKVSRVERRVLRALVLACLSATTCRYVAWSLAVAITYLRHAL
jgi:hypothetical protein